MYEMVAGRVPFQGDNTVTVALAHLEDPITPPSYYNEEIPIGLENIILKSTEKKPEFRYGSMHEVVADLRKALVNPDGDFVQYNSQVDDSRTVIIESRSWNRSVPAARYRETASAARNSLRNAARRETASLLPETTGPEDRTRRILILALKSF